VPLTVARLRWLLLFLVQVLERVRHFAPEPVSEDVLPSRPVHYGALELSEAAMSPKTLCRMEPTWMPWY
jgi:transformation/transcription domain-associated protein